MTTQDSTPRLSVVAAIIGRQAAGPDAEGCDTNGSDSGVRDCEGHAATVLPVRVARLPNAMTPSLRDSATGTERALAEALRCDRDQEQAARSQDPVVAELLLLADDLPESGELAAALSETFLPPGDSTPALAQPDRTTAFADLYRRLALAQLNNQVRNRVAAALGGLRRSRRAAAD